MRQYGFGGRDLRTLFKIGAVGGLTDGELLSRFISQRGETAELAFAALVGRHGPMVLRVCRSILCDEHAAEDAFQATFLILVRRANAVRKQSSVASWLHGVALRVANSARGATARRSLHERRAAELAISSSPGTRDEPDLVPVLHMELGRLPERYRAVVVLCYLEGLTCAEAAARLGWPVGTVKSRLARGRERLHGRLIRRGLAPSAALIGTLLSVQAASGGISSSLVEPIVRIATYFYAGQAAGVEAVPASVAALTRRMLILMFVNKLTLSICLLLVLAAASVGISPFARGTSAVLRVVRAQDAKASGGNQTQVRPEQVLERALRMADQITVPWMKAQALADIAAAQARLRQPEMSRATFRRVAEIIEGIENNAFSRAANLSWLAKAKASAGDLEGARATIAQIIAFAPQIDDKGSRHSLLQVAAVRQAKAGDAQGALDLMIALHDAPAAVHAYVLAEIAGEQAKAGDLRGALQTMARADALSDRAEKGPEPDGVTPPRSLDGLRAARVRGMVPVAEAHFKAGEIDEARATLRRARAIVDRGSEEFRPPPLAEIAMAQKQVEGQEAAETTLRLALNVAEGLKLPDQRIDALARIAIVQADAGDRTAARVTLDKAIQIADTLSDKGKRADQVISAARQRVGDWEAGRRAALSLDDVILRANHIEALTFGQAKSGEARSAMDWADTQTDALLRAHGLLGVVRGIIEKKTPPVGK